MPKRLRTGRLHRGSHRPTQVSIKLVEAYTNEDDTDRKGILLFLDMEKAFDRVSYDFTLAGLKAFGIGKTLPGVD